MKAGLSGAIIHPRVGGERLFPIVYFPPAWKRWDGEADHHGVERGTIAAYLCRHCGVPVNGGADRSGAQAMGFFAPPVRCVPGERAEGRAPGEDPNRNRPPSVLTQTLLTERYGRRFHDPQRVPVAVSPHETGSPNTGGRYWAGLSKR